ncbi:MAG: hypothetical protein ACJATT_004097 [Myxococcota bacterium]|jgi:hypothetical protein
MSSKTKEHPRTAIGGLIDSVTLAKLMFMAAAGASLALSMWLWFTGHKDQGMFVGLWVPTALALGTLVTSGGNDE